MCRRPAPGRTRVQVWSLYMLPLSAFAVHKACSECNKSIPIKMRIHTASMELKHPEFKRCVAVCIDAVANRQWLLHWLQVFWSLAPAPQGQGDILPSGCIDVGLAGSGHMMAVRAAA